MWTNQYLIYDSLSVPMRELVDGLSATHTAAVFGHPEIQAEHPAVRVHPETGRKSLYLNRQFTTRFPQLRPSESDALLDYLCTYSERPEFTVRYRWRAGAIGIWDNRCTQHHAVNDYDEPRVIHRVTIIGDHPEGAAPRWPHYEPLRMGAEDRSLSAAAGP
jgi:taurine dioxygenase